MEKEQVSSGNIIDFKVLRRIMRFVKPYRSRFYFLIFLTLAIGILTPLRPLLIQWTLDNQVANGDYQGMLMLMLGLVGYLFL